MKRLSLLAVWLACIGAAAITLLRMLWSILSNPAKALRIAVALDRAGNAAANGVETETLSSRANRARSEGRRWGCILCRWLDWLDPHHCRDSAGT